MTTTAEAQHVGALTLKLGDGETIAELMGDGIVVLEQPEPGSKFRSRVVVTKADLERLLEAL